MKTAERAASKGTTPQCKPTLGADEARWVGFEWVLRSGACGPIISIPKVMAHVQGYPTLLFFPAQAGAEVVPVEEERTLGSLTKFIKDNAKVAFELPKKDNKKAAEEAAEDAKDEL